MAHLVVIIYDITLVQMASDSSFSRDSWVVVHNMFCGMQAPSNVLGAVVRVTGAAKPISECGGAGLAY